MQVDREETLGEREVRGKLPPEVAASLEKIHGADWRRVTVGEAIEANESAFEEADRSLLHHHGEAEDARERQRIGRALIRRAQAGQPLNDETIRSVLDELYGGEPSARRMNLVLDVVANVNARLRGEDPHRDTSELE